MDVFQYTTRFQNFRGGMFGLPSWARFLVFLVAIPGIVLVSLSIFAIGVSILALLLPTVPLYRFLKAVTNRAAEPAPTAEVGQYSIIDPAANDSPRKRVEATVIDSPAGDDRPV